MGGWWYKIVINLPGTYPASYLIGSYPVKESPNGSAVSENLRYTQTERKTDILLLYYKDYHLGQSLGAKLLVTYIAVNLPAILLKNSV